LEEVQRLEAQSFVKKIKMIYPEVNFDKDFEEFGIKDDDIAKAYYCEAFLEAMNCDWLAGYLVKSGIGKTGSPPAKQRRKKFIHDGALNRALVQLTLKVYRLDPHKDEDRKKVKPKARKLAERIWKRARKLKGGRVGEALGPPLSFREGPKDVIPAPLGGPSCESRSHPNFIRSRGPRHPVILTTTTATSYPPPFSPLDIYQFKTSMGSLFNTTKLSLPRQNVRGRFLSVRGCT